MDNKGSDRMEHLLEVHHLKKYFPITAGVFSRKVGEVRAVDDLSFVVRKGETLGIVGESGCGKSTTGKLLLRLLEPTSGEIYFEGEDILRLPAETLRQKRKQMQMVFQDPYASLNPRQTVEQILEEPLIVHRLGTREERRQRVKQLLELIGFPSSYAKRYPHQFSGGQRQRIGIARALSVFPKLIVADEPVSALDVSIQAQILNLMQDIQEEFQLTYIFISHDLSVVQHITNRVLVMYLGQMVEIATTNELYERPLHPYTQALLSAVPIPDPTVQRERIILQGDIPSPSNPPTGCRFHTRCIFATEQCKVERPLLKTVSEHHQVACHLY